MIASIAIPALAQQIKMRQENICSFMAQDIVFNDGQDV
jgi:hypothetical protein